MSSAAVLQRVNPQAQAALLKMKREAAAMMTKQAGDTATSVTILQGVNRARLASLMAPLAYTAEVVIIEMPVSLHGLPTLTVKALKVTTPTSDHYQGANVNPEADEEATLRHLAATGDGFGRVELWGIRDHHTGGAEDRYVWATVAALISHYPDAITRERRSLAGVHAGSSIGPALVQRLNVIHPDERRA